MGSWAWNAAREREADVLRAEGEEIRERDKDPAGYWMRRALEAERNLRDRMRDLEWSRARLETARLNLKEIFEESNREHPERADVEHICLIAQSGLRHSEGVDGLEPFRKTLGDWAR